MGGTSDKVQGQAKEVAGIVTSDKDLEAEGKTDRRTGEVKDKVEGFVDNVKDKAEAAADKAKDMLHRK